MFDSSRTSLLVFYPVGIFVWSGHPGLSGHHDLSGYHDLSGHPGGSGHPSLSGHPVCLVTPVSLVTPLLSRVIATRDSCAGPFFVVQKYRFLDLWTDFQSCNIKFIMLYSLGKSRTTRKKE